MKLTPYKKILKYSKEKIQEALAGPRAKQAKLQAHLKIAEIDEVIASQEQQISELCAEHPINFDSVLDAMDKLALNERRQKQIKKVIYELFEADEEEENKGE